MRAVPRTGGGELPLKEEQPSDGRRWTSDGGKQLQRREGQPTAGRGKLLGEMLTGLSILKSENR